MEFDDILYFLFLAAWVIFGAVRKRNKNQAASKRRPNQSIDRRQATAEPKPAKSFSDIITELSYQAEQARTRVYEPTAQEDISNDYQEISPPATQNEIIEEEKPAFSKFDKSLVKKRNQSKASQSELLEDFDLKKAVIYETILNRKYF